MVGVKNTATTTAQSVTDSAGNTYTKVVAIPWLRVRRHTEMSVLDSP